MSLKHTMILFVAIGETQFKTSLLSSFLRYFFSIIYYKAPNLMRGEANNWWICQDGDKYLRLEKLMSSWDFEWSSQASKTSGQCTEHLIEDHLPCAVILQIIRKDITNTNLEFISLLRKSQTSYPAIYKKVDSGKRSVLWRKKELKK